MGINPMLSLRRAHPKDAATLAAMNAHLIRDEGHRNRMSIPELERRLAAWLGSGYEAVLFALPDDPSAGYALFRRETEFVYLRHFFVKPEYRRNGLGRKAMDLLSRDVWSRTSRVRVDVLTGNHAGRAFWQALGFREYAVTMEAEAPSESRP